MSDYLISKDWTEENKERLIASIRANSFGRKRKVAVFDFDNTCIQHDIGDALFDRMTQQRQFSLSSSFWEIFEDQSSQAQELFATEKTTETDQALRRFMFGYYNQLESTRSQVEAYEWISKTLTGLSLKTIHQHCQSAIFHALRQPLRQETLELPETTLTLSHGVRIRTAIADLIHAMQLVGIEVWICSASNIWLVRAMAQLFGVPSNRVIGVELEVENGHTLPILAHEMTSREGKVEAILRVIGEQPFFAAGDSRNDFEMLDFASELSILMAPKDDELEQEALSKGWLIQPTFSNFHDFGA